MILRTEAIMQAKSLASIRSQPAAVKLNCRNKEKENKTKQGTDSPDITFLYRFVLQQKLPAIPKGLFTNASLFLLDSSSC